MCGGGAWRVSCGAGNETQSCLNPPRFDADVVLYVSIQRRATVLLVARWQPVHVLGMVRVLYSPFLKQGTHDAERANAAYNPI